MDVMADSQTVIDNKRKERISHLDYNSVRMGELSRIISFGLAGLYFVFSTSSSTFAQNTMVHFTWVVVAVSVCGCFAIIFEWLQYFLGYRMAREAAARVADPDPNKGLFPKTLVKDLQIGMFWAKQIAAVAGTLILIGLMYATIP